MGRKILSSSRLPGRAADVVELAARGYRRAMPRGGKAPADAEQQHAPARAPVTAAPEVGTSAGTVLALQQTAGNAATSRILRAVLQARADDRPDGRAAEHGEI